MKHSVLILMLAASALAADAQTPSKPAAPAAATSPAKSAGAAATAKPAVSAAKPAIPATSPLIATTIKAPATLPPVKGLQKPLFTVALRYQEIKIGDGPVAESGKLYKVFYTGYRASDGKIFDSTDLHRMPMRDKDGKPVLGDDGKPKLGDPQPMPFPQGKGGTIIGFDQGFVGMKVHGKRRFFIPWQLAYGTREVPDRGADHPGIPAKSDLIFDVELVDVTDIPAPQARPNMPMGGRPMPPRPVTPGAPGAAPNAAAPVTPSAPPAPGAAPATPAPAPSTPPPTPAATPAQPESK